MEKKENFYLNSIKTNINTLIQKNKWIRIFMLVISLIQIIVFLWFLLLKEKVALGFLWDFTAPKFLIPILTIYIFLMSIVFFYVEIEKIFKKQINKENFLIDDLFIRFCNKVGFFLYLNSFLLFIIILEYLILSWLLSPIVFGLGIVLLFVIIGYLNEYWAKIKFIEYLYKTYNKKQ